ncbi:triacylglycerol lipase like protein [Teratosphaeria destructans]|uniref:Triacylglycerol lipase like protein n=1 Tax=Teratosphaeria destructans TaxID=418781 RepID=A0A9W7VY50_9PEZI|nr:triacylglycerol lipase like protein [Teratosphaeria destructans]
MPSTTAPPDRPSVTIPTGTFRGKILDDPNHPVPIEAWLGIATPSHPCSDLRFARPCPSPPAPRPSTPSPTDPRPRPSSSSRCRACRRRRAKTA